MITNTAIIYFSRSAAAELKHKTFCDSNGFISKSVARRLYQHSLTAVKNAGFPWFTFDEHNQSGEHFGDRLATAFSQVFALGFTNVIAVGSDTPALDAGKIKQAAGLLKTHGLVTGPTQAGGCYLLGLQARYFNQDVFAALPWQTATLLNALVTTHSDDVAWLPLEAELNNEQQVLQMAAMPAAATRLVQWCILLLRSLFNSSIQYFPALQVITVSYSPVSPGRAP